MTMSLQQCSVCAAHSRRLHTARTGRLAAGSLLTCRDSVSVKCIKSTCVCSSVRRGYFQLQFVCCADARRFIDGCPTRVLCLPWPVTSSQPSFMQSNRALISPVTNLFSDINVALASSAQFFAISLSAQHVVSRTASNKLGGIGCL